MNPLALDFIKKHEGCKLSAYSDSVGVPTIGWGATGPAIRLGVVWTQEQADDDLAARVSDIQGDIKSALNLHRAPPITQEQEAALISFAYNVGIVALISSTLFRYVTEGEWLDATKEFQRWDKASGREPRGLLIRRLEEALLFVNGS